MSSVLFRQTQMKGTSLILVRTNTFFRSSSLIMADDIHIIITIIIMLLHSTSGRWRLSIRFHNHISRHTVGLLGRVISQSKASTYTGQHNIEKSMTKVHAPSGIRTRDLAYERSRPTPINITYQLKIQDRRELTNRHSG
jgi:hypothetical protein